MQYSVVQYILIFVVTFIAAIDQFNFLESLYQPIVMGAVVGGILGDIKTGLAVGGIFQLMMIGNMPIGGAQPPNAVIGGIMATVLAISSGLEPTVAVAAAFPFAILGQYAVTIIFTLMSPMMAVADNHAHNANPKGIVKLNYLAMTLLGLAFGVIVLLFFMGGQTIGDVIQSKFPAWLMGGLSAAGGMMRFVGFAILLKVMISKELWGFYFLGFALATIVVASASLQGPALVILAFIGFALAYWDYQINTKISANAGVQNNNGGEEDGI